VFSENSAWWTGGGLSALLESRVVLEDCQFVRNTADAEGGGAAIDTSQAMLRRCTFVGNAGALVAAGGGGAMAIQNSTVAIDDTVCSGNSGDGDGGAMAIAFRSNVTLRNTTIVENDAPFRYGHSIGGAICAGASRITLLNSLVRGN